MGGQAVGWKSTIGFRSITHLVGLQNMTTLLVHFLIMSRDAYFHFISGLYLSNHLKYFNDTWYDY